MLVAAVAAEETAVVAPTRGIAAGGEVMQGTAVVGEKWHPWGGIRASGLMERWVMVKGLWSLSAKCRPRKRENADVEEQQGRRFALSTKEASTSLNNSFNEPQQPALRTFSLAKGIPAGRRLRRVSVGKRLFSKPCECSK